MKQSHIKWLMIIGLALWVLLFTYDSVFGIHWPSELAQRIFIWFPTVIIGVYWLVFGGQSKDKK